MGAAPAESAPVSAPQPVSIPLPFGYGIVPSGNAQSFYDSHSRHQEQIQSRGTIEKTLAAMAASQMSPSTAGLGTGRNSFNEGMSSPIGQALANGQQTQIPNMAQYAMDMGLGANAFQNDVTRGLLNSGHEQMVAARTAQDEMTAQAAERQRAEAAVLGALQHVGGVPGEAMESLSRLERGDREFLLSRIRQSGPATSNYLSAMGRGDHNRAAELGTKIPLNLLTGTAQNIGNSNEGGGKENIKTQPLTKATAEAYEGVRAGDVVPFNKNMERELRNKNYGPFTSSMRGAARQAKADFKKIADDDKVASAAPVESFRDSDKEDEGNRPAPPAVLQWHPRDGYVPEDFLEIKAQEYLQSLNLHPNQLAQLGGQDASASQVKKRIENAYKDAFLINNERWLADMTGQ